MFEPKYHNSTLAERAAGGNPLGSIEGNPNNSTFGSRGKSTPKKAADKSVESDDEGVEDKRVRRGGSARK